MFWLIWTICWLYEGTQTLIWDWLCVISYCQIRKESVWLGLKIWEINCRPFLQSFVSSCSVIIVSGDRLAALSMPVFSGFISFLWAQVLFHKVSLCNCLTLLAISLKLVWNDVMFSCSFLKKVSCFHCVWFFMFGCPNLLYQTVVCLYFDNAYMVCI